MQASFRSVRTTASRLLVVSLVSSGAASALADVGGATSAVVYGTDDRVDYYDIVSPTFQDLARSSIVALVPKADIRVGGIGLTFPPFTNVVPTLDQYVETLTGTPACQTLRFADQPTPAFCSGTLIGEDLVLTAGHCLRTQTDCNTMGFVFDLYMSSATTLETIDENDVYGCSSILVRAQTQQPHIDYAVVQLDRPVVGRTPASVRTVVAPLAVGTPLNVIGFGTGLPMKFDDGGEVRDPHASTLDTFVADTDTFAGNSGSGVFDDNGTLVGILVSGATDYDASSGCTDVNVLTAAEAEEESTYVHHAVTALCAGGLPTSICPENGTPSCGDGFCSAGEDGTTCAADCLGDRCPDGVCGASENSTNCPYDCTQATVRRSKGGCSAAGAAREGGLTGVALAAVAVAASRGRRRNRRGSRA